MRSRLFAVFVVSMGLLTVLAGGCGGSKKSPSFTGDDDSGSSTFGGAPGGSSSSSGGDDGTGPTSVFDPGDGGTPNYCPAGSPLSCYVSTCASGSTTLTGKVYDPAGKNPLPNVVVFVPNDVTKLPPITGGTDTCSSCNTPVGDYVTVALTDKTGTFTLTGVPTGKNVPLVIQIGKWRRVITVASVADCQTTKVPDSGSGQARLPAKHSEGSLPMMALLTGGLDDLGCFMTRMGLDPSEYSAPGAGGHLDIYQGFGLAGVAGPTLSTGTAGDCTNTNCPLWASKKSLEAYDIVLLACEGAPYDPDAANDGLAFGGTAANITPAAKQAMHDWVNEGGKLFATHYHYTWFDHGPADWQGVATWLGSSIALFGTAEGTVDTSFVKGQNLKDWLGEVGALDTTGGLALTEVGTSVSAINTQVASRWIYNAASADGKSDTKYFSFDAPIGGLAGTSDAGDKGPQYCGKAVFSDLHAGGQPLGNVPGACKAADLTPQEKTLEFLFFDLAACVTDDTKPPPIPPPLPE